MRAREVRTPLPLFHIGANAAENGMRGASLTLPRGSRLSLSPSYDMFLLLLGLRGRATNFARGLSEAQRLRNEQDSGVRVRRACFWLWLRGARSLSSLLALVARESSPFPLVRLSKV